MKKYILFLVFVLTQFSCSDTIENIEPSDLLGEWHSENSHINEQPVSDFLNGGQLYSSILGLKVENFYFLDYSSGEWSINRNKLNLSNRGEFEIISYSGDIMTLKGEVLAGDLYWELEGISPFETITLQQDYRRK